MPLHRVENVPCAVHEGQSSGFAVNVPGRGDMHAAAAAAPIWVIETISRSK